MRRLALAVVATLLLAACGGGGDSSSQKSPVDWNATPSTRPIEVTFWYSFAAGPNQDAVTYLVNKFNEAHQGQIHVSAVFTGNYDDTFAKIKTGIQSNQLPSLAQVYDIGTRFMIDSGIAQPMQVFIDHDNYKVGDLWPNIRGYYEINGKLFSMPWNTSMPLLYFNENAFRAAGLDPAKPPRTLDEIRQYATVLKQHGQPGFGAAIYGWFLEQFTAVAGKQYCDNGNGRDKAASKLLFDQPADVKLLDWWAQMVKDGLAFNSGRPTVNAQNAFKAGQVAINLESTGVLRSYQAASGFTVGTGPFPQIDSSSSGGPIIGGASLWIVGKKPSYEQRATWEFVKFLTQPDNQAYFHTHTGYFPPNKKALDEPSDKQWVAQYPQFKTVIEQLQRTKVDKATQGCLLGVMPQARQTAEDAMEKALTGKQSPQQALQDAVKTIQPTIDSYNQSVSGG